MTDTYRLSVCQCCMLVHANGECCDQEHGTEDYPQPWNLFPADDTVTAGLLYAEHNEGCLFKRMGSDAPDDYQCDCEQSGFSWSACEGCGCKLAGDRYGMTGWVGDRSKV